MTTVRDLNERISITVDAVQLGWVINQDGVTTSFDYKGRRLTVWWTVDGIADRAELRTEASHLLCTRAWFGDHGSVGGWVRDALRTWRIEYVGGVSA
ncbi:hypothetical protein [Nocardia sp. NPDC051463]|uniref:hypothetical protein n=1 Tax=Nocardia sp. NPDC051463 TaxID=3154845 RepID=UPI00344C8518